MCERRGVDGGESRHEAALVLAVVEQSRLGEVITGGELLALESVSHGDVESEFRSDHGGAVKRDAALDQSSEHREEAASR